MVRKTCLSLWTCWGSELRNFVGAMDTEERTRRFLQVSKGDALLILYWRRRARRHASHPNSNRRPVRRINEPRKCNLAERTPT